MKKLAFKQRLFFAVTILVTSMILIGFFVYRYVNLNNIKENEEPIGSYTESGLFLIHSQFPDVCVICQQQT